MSQSISEQRFRAKLKAFLQEFGYRDGIGFLQWQKSGSAITGIFGDRSGSKAFEFTINTSDGLSYKPAASYRKQAFVRQMAATRTDAKQKRNCTSPTSYSCGASCINNSKQCRIRDLKVRNAASAMLRDANTLTITQVVPGKPEVVKQVLEREEAQIRNLRYERAVLIDSRTGQVLLNKGGSRTQVDFDASDVMRMKGQVLTHNHPSYPGISFSSSDILCACIGEVSEVRAVTPVYTHSMLPPTGGFNRKFFDEEVAPSYNKHYEENYKFLVGEIIQGRMSASEADSMLMHYTWEAVAYDTGMTYTRQSVKRKSWWGKNGSTN